MALIGMSLNKTLDGSYWGLDSSLLHANNDKMQNNKQISFFIVQRFY